MSARLIRRRPDWPERLAAGVAALRGEAFVWGSSDCCCVTFDLVEAMTGEQLFPRRYKTERGLLAIGRRRHGAGDVHGLATALLGAPIAPALAQRGDVVSIEVAPGGSLGVVLGGAAAFMSRDGLVMIEAAAWRAAWRI